MLLVVYFCFFQHKTAYEIRMSDWSSDVCSSDLLLAQPVDGAFEVAGGFAERLLAVHHAGPGHLAELLDQSRGDLSHSSRPHPVVCPGYAAPGAFRPGATRNGISGRCRGLLALSRPRSRRLVRREMLHRRLGRFADVLSTRDRFLLQPVEHRLTHQLAIELDGPDGVVIARDRIVDAGGGGIGVDHGDHRKDRKSTRLNS